PRPPRQRGAERPTAPARPRRILLVDDNVDFATSLAVLLESLGHEVRIAHDGEAALEAAAELEPEVAFLDIGLPGISGYDVAAKLRALPAGGKITMMALSGWGRTEDKQRSPAAGCAGQRVEPVGIATIGDALARRAAGPG